MIKIVYLTALLISMITIGAYWVRRDTYGEEESRKKSLKTALELVGIIVFIALTVIVLGFLIGAITDYTMPLE